jgi:hypothetical protein
MNIAGRLSGELELNADRWDRLANRKSVHP